jgi:iron complex transport system substrate-binding protein
MARGARVAVVVAVVAIEAMAAIATMAARGALASSRDGVPVLRDADGRVVPTTPPAVRIAALAPSLTELVYAAGAGTRLVAVSAYSDYPPAAKSLPVVADYAGISFESLLAAQPDLVLTWKGGTRESDVARLQSARTRLFAINVQRLADVPAALRAIGALSGQERTAESAASEFERQIDRLKRDNRNKRQVRVFFEMASKPWLSINREHFISEAMAACNGENVFGDLPSQIVEPSRETLLARDAEVVLYAGGSRPFDWAPYQGLTAEKQRHAFPLTADFILRPGPRLSSAVAEICDALDRVRGAK